MIDLCIDAFGNFCNSSPVLNIRAGSKVLWSGEIFGYQQIRCKIPTHTHIVVGGIGKVNGEQGVYDTYVDELGNIVNDKYLKILNVAINGIGMDQQWLNNLVLINEFDSRKFDCATFWHNGEVSFDVHEPVLDWIIEKKYIQFTQHLDARLDAKSGQDKFYYQPMIKQIQKIKSMLNDQDISL